MHKNNFDFLRLLAAGLVLVSHQHALTGLPEPSVFGIRSFGTVGVLIFFSISGYLVSQSWIRSPSITIFARNRLTRIWPGFAMVTVLAALVLGPIVTTKPLDEYLLAWETRGYLHQVVFVMRDQHLPGVFESNVRPWVNGSLWTIPLELILYVILAALGLVGILRRPWVLLTISGALLSATVGMVYAGRPIDPLQEFGTFFMLGMCLSAFRSLVFAHRHIVFAGAVALSLVFAGVGLGYLGLVVGIPLLSIIGGESKTFPLNRVGRFGDFSYGFYLYAFPVQQTVIWATGNRLPFSAALVLCAVITYLLAALSWHFVESPALRFKSRRQAVATAMAVE